MASSSISHRMWLLRLRPIAPQRIPLGAPPLRWSRWGSRTRASSADADADAGEAGRSGVDWIARARVSADRAAGRLQEALAAVPPVVFAIKRNVGSGSKLAVSISAAFFIVVIILRKVLSGNTNHSQRGSVADLVRRGQLRSDRRGISKPLKYDDPFNNPLVKVHKTNSTVEMCGKVYQMASITLTEEQRSSHRKRRSRAYKWTRPTIFLKEGDEIPSEVDPDTVRWIPANHPFATTVSDIDEGTAQSNVYQTDGVPFRIRAEHEALQRKLEMLQTPSAALQEQKPNKISAASSGSHDIEQQSKSSREGDKKPGSSPSVDGEFGQTLVKSHAEEHPDNNHPPEGLKMGSKFPG